MDVILTLSFLEGEGEIFLHIFWLITRFRNKYLDFCKFAIFLQIIEVESKGFSKTYQML